MSEQVFHRRDIALKIATQILDKGIGSPASSGLFLAAPRRTGKSTFVREDLRPALQEAGAVVIYIDLWSNRQTDPGALIEQAIRQELSKYEGMLTKLAKSSGMEKLNVGGLAFNLDKVGLGKDISLSIALAALSDEVKKPIALIIDEAQHSATSESGYAAMFALKAARDELNSSQHHGLRIIATGSNRDKLAMLRNSKDQAFFGAPLIDFPRLGKDYIQWFCTNANLPGPVDPQGLYEAFVSASNRPELLYAAVQEVKFDFSIEASQVHQKLVDAVMNQVQIMDEQTLRIIRALTPLQSATLTVLAYMDDKYAPFDESTMKLYKLALKAVNAQEKTSADTSSIQQALAALQDKNLVWKEKRGSYSLEESTTADILESHGFFDAFKNMAPKLSKPGR